MMKKGTGILLLLLLTSCAAMSPPSSDLIDSKAVVTMGAEAPQDNDYILYVPADQEFPIVLTVNGSMFNKEGRAGTSVSFRRDLYLYKTWASYNGRDWQKLDQLFGISVSAGMQYDGGIIKVGLEERPQQVSRH